jgi:hypothetical protein
MCPYSVGLFVQHGGCVIIATRAEAEIRRIEVQDQPRTNSPKKLITKKG